MVQGSCRTPCGGVFSVSLGKHHLSLLFYSNCFKLLSFLKTPNSYFEFVHGTKMPREMFVKFGIARVGNYLPLNLRFNTLHLSLAFCIEPFTRSRILQHIAIEQTNKPNKLLLTCMSKMAIILPTGQWYAPSAVFNDIWYCMVLHDIA